MAGITFQLNFSGETFVKVIEPFEWHLFIRTRIELRGFDITRAKGDT